MNMRRKHIGFMPHNYIAKKKEENNDNDNTRDFKLPRIKRVYNL
jgi:hypothetical protein